VSPLALLAAAPALPLGKAGKYVAAAYVVFVAVLLIYFGIMAIKLSRMQRELAELNAALDVSGEPERSFGSHARPEARSQGSRSDTGDAGLDAPPR
jgi:hypothetical protein